MEVFLSVASRAAAAEIPPIRIVRGAFEGGAGPPVVVNVDGELSLRLAALALEIAAIRQHPSVQMHNLGQPCPE